MKDITKLKRGLRLAQEKKGYSFNRNTPFVDRIIESLAANLERYGYMACPCRLATGERKTDRPIICPCDYRDDDVRDYGVCYCGLFVSTKNKDKDFNSVNVPERHVYKD